MATEKYANTPTPSSPSTAWTTLSAGVNAAVTTLPVVSASAFPSTAQYRIRVEDELMLVTAGTGTTSWTVTRGVEGSTAATHALGAGVSLILTAASLLRSPGALTTTGDLPYLDSVGAPARLAAGADATYLRYASGLPTASALLMADLSGSGITYGTDTTLERGAAAGQMTLSAGSSSPSLRLKNGSAVELGAMYWSANSFIVGTQGGVGAGAARDTILSSALDLILAAGGTSRWAVDDTLGHLRPFADATYDLGGTSLHVRAAYVDKLGLLTTNGLVTTSAGDGTLGITALGTGVGTFLTTPSSANLLAAITDETGTGLLVFATSPTLVTPVLGVATATSIAPLNFSDANTLEQYNSTTAQTFRVYNTRTDASNYERIGIDWASNVARIYQTSAGTGAVRTFALRTSLLTNYAAFDMTDPSNYGSGGSVFRLGASNAASGVLSVSAFTLDIGNLSGTVTSRTATSGVKSTVYIQEKAAPTSTSTMVFSSLTLAPTINYSAGTPGAGSYEALKIAAVETALPTGTSYLIRASAGSAGTTDMFTVGNQGNTAIAGTLGVTGATTLTSTLAANGIITMGDGINIVTNGTTGTKIGTATSNKIGMWNATPIVQPTTAIAASTFTANTSLIANDTATFDGYTLGQIVKALRNIGLLA